MTRTVLLTFALLTPLLAFKDATPQDQVDGLATALQKGDAKEALQFFDPAMPSFAEVNRSIEALSSLPNTTCAITINRTSREGDSIRFEADWSLQTYSVQNGPLVDRRDPVTITLRQTDHTWKIVALSPLAVLATPDDAVFKRVARLVGDLNDKDQFGAIGAFSSEMKEYGEIDNDIDALISQNDLLCAIDIVSDRQTGDVHTLDLDWFIQLKSRTDGGPLQTRRERVQVRMKKFQEKWKIFFIEPMKILSPEIPQ